MSNHLLKDVVIIKGQTGPEVVTYDDLLTCFEKGLEYPVVTFENRNVLSKYIHYPVWPAPELWVAKILNLRICSETQSLIGDIEILNDEYKNIITANKLSAFGVAIADENDIRDLKQPRIIKYRYMFRFCFILENT